MTNREKLRALDKKTHLTHAQQAALIHYPDRTYNEKSFRKMLYGEQIVEDYVIEQLTEIVED